LIPTIQDAGRFRDCALLRPGGPNRSNPAAKALAYLKCCRGRLERRMGGRFQILSKSTGSRRFQTLLAGAFAGGALLLACLGIYGVISYSVARRTSEMGIRIALGAQASQVSLLVLRQGIQPVLGGLAVGVAGALAAGKLISGFLFGTQPRDPAAISTVVFMLLLVAGLACWAPARRASRIDPMTALRDE
jgi:ABC-type antimicrobial peptide transport system permease subunit